jgi:hypothetical protein
VQESIVKARSRAHVMGGESRFGGAHRPDVQVMHLAHPGKSAQIAVGVARGRTSLPKPRDAPREQQTDNVGEVVCSVRHQGERVGEIPKTQLGQYNEDVESDRDRKGNRQNGRANGCSQGRRGGEVRVRGDRVPC